MKLPKNVSLNLVFLLAVATPLLMVLSRNIATPIFAGLSILLAVSALGQDRSGFSRGVADAINRPAFWVGISLLAYMAATAFWSPAPKRAFESTVHLAGNAVLLVFALVSLSVLWRRARPDRWLPVILIIGAAVLVGEELAFTSPVRTALGGTAEPFRLNRAAVAVVLFLPFCAALLARDWKSGVFMIAASLITGCAVLLSASESAKLAFFVFLISFPIFHLLGRTALFWLGSAIVVSLVLMPLLAGVLPDLLPGWMMEGVAYGSFGIRADIWAAFASLLNNAPFLGHGVEASHVAGETYKHTGVHNGLLGWGHPHNFAIQVWYELGAVGVVLISGLIVMYFRALDFVPDRFLPGVLSTTAAVWAVSMVSHGAWQAWWWSLVGILAVLWGLLIRSETAEVGTAAAD